MEESDKAYTNCVFHQITHEKTYRHPLFLADLFTCFLDGYSGDKGRYKLLRFSVLRCLPLCAAFLRAFLVTNTSMNVYAAICTLTKKRRLVARKSRGHNSTINASCKAIQTNIYIHIYYNNSHSNKTIKRKRGKKENEEGSK